MGNAGSYDLADPRFETTVRRARAVLSGHSVATWEQTVFEAQQLRCPRASLYRQTRINIEMWSAGVN